MRILLINKYYWPKGGAETHLFALQRLLEAHGHTVSIFSMQHPQNLPAPTSRFFVSRVDFDRMRPTMQGLRVAGRMLYSFEASRKLRALIRATRPDIAHVHNLYHQLSPSLLPVLRKAGIPVVMTLHDYKLVSPNYLLFCHGRICAHTKPFHPWRAVRHKCVKNSALASAVCALEATLHRRLGLYDRTVNAYISPSRFLMTTLAAYGWPTENVRHLPNFIAQTEDNPPQESRSGIVYVGRLSEEKGLDVLLDAAPKIPFPITLIGNGPLMHHLRQRAQREGLHHVIFLGERTGPALRTAMAMARVVAVPSVCYENFPMTVLEAFNARTPVVASRIGGIPEIVQEGVSGYLVPPGNASALAERLTQLSGNAQESAQLGNAGYDHLASYRPERYYEQLMTLYASLLHHR